MSESRPVPCCSPPQRPQITHSQPTPPQAIAQLLHDPATGQQISRRFLLLPASCGVSEANPQTDPLLGRCPACSLASPTRWHAGSIRRPRLAALSYNLTSTNATSELIAVLLSSGKRGLIVCLVLLSAAVQPVNNGHPSSSPSGRKRSSVLLPQNLGRNASLVPISRSMSRHVDAGQIVELQART